MRVAFCLASILVMTPAVAQQQGVYVPNSGSVDLSAYAKKSDVPTLAPVQKVNGAVGNVVVPTVQRIVSTPQDATSGTITWSFTNAASVSQGTPANFLYTPTCVESVFNGNPSQYAIDAAQTTAVSPTSVTITLSAHLRALLLNTLFNTVNPPSGSTATIVCTAPAQ